MSKFSINTEYSKGTTNRCYIYYSESGEFEDRQQVLSVDLHTGFGERIKYVINTKNNQLERVAVPINATEPKSREAMSVALKGCEHDLTPSDFAKVKTAIDKWNHVGKAKVASGDAFAALIGETPVNSGSDSPL